MFLLKKELCTPDVGQEEAEPEDEEDEDYNAREGNSVAHVSQHAGNRMQVGKSVLLVVVYGAMSRCCVWHVSILPSLR